jgi:hypothetical protein
MAAYEERIRRRPRIPKTADELDAWMIAAVSVLRGSDAERKRVKMDYKWENFTNTADWDDKPRVVERSEDIEVD